MRGALESGVLTDLAAAVMVEPSDTMPLVSVEGTVPRHWTRLNLTGTLVLMLAAVAVMVSVSEAQTGPTSGESTASISLGLDEEYDAIVLGTGLTESVISAMLSQAGNKVLQLDRNTYYGTTSETVAPLSVLYERFNETLEMEDKFGSGSEWNVDMVPKLLLGKSEMSKLLIQSEALDARRVQADRGRLRVQTWKQRVQGAWQRHRVSFVVHRWNFRRETYEKLFDSGDQPGFRRCANVSGP